VVFASGVLKEEEVGPLNRPPAHYGRVATYFALAMSCAWFGYRVAELIFAAQAIMGITVEWGWHPAR
jgi:hypothetical protein